MFIFKKKKYRTDPEKRRFSGNGPGQEKENG